MLLCFNKGTTKVGLTIYKHRECFIIQRGGTKVGHAIYKHRGYTESNNNTVIKVATGADGLIISKF